MIENQKRIDEIELNQKKLDGEISTIKKDTGEIKTSLSLFDSKMTENISQVARCLETLITLVEKDKHTERRIADLEGSDKVKTEHIAKLATDNAEKYAALDKQIALNTQASENVQVVASEIRETIKTGGWKLIGFTVGVISLIVTLGAGAIIKLSN